MMSSRDVIHVELLSGIQFVNSHEEYSYARVKQADMPILRIIRLDRSHWSGVTLWSPIRPFFCSFCEIGITWPQPELETLEQLYAPGNYRGEEGKRFVKPVEILFELHEKWLSACLSKKYQPGEMLDIGCGSGFLASLFVRAGWNVTGVELNDETAVHARETYGIRVFTNVFSITDQFDLILINHVLEHH